VLVDVIGTNKKKIAAIPPATIFFGSLLMSRRLSDLIHVTIKLDPRLVAEHEVQGLCEWEDTNDRPREFTLHIDAGMTMADTLSTVAHEMVHLKQMAKGEFMEYIRTVQPLIRFNSQKYTFGDDQEYWDYPWEIEAYGRQIGLYTRYMERK
jgi:hypothetical protein